MKRFAAVAVAALVLTPGLFAAGDAAKGKDLYAAKCKTCHGLAGEGNAGMAKVLKVDIRALGSKEVQAKKDEALKKDVTDGVGKMKGVAGIAAGDLDNLIAFIRTLK